MTDDRRAELLARVNAAIKSAPCKGSCHIYNSPTDYSNPYCSCDAKAEAAIAALTDETPQAGQAGVGEAPDLIGASLAANLATAYRRMGGIARLARQHNGAAIIRDIAVREAAALLATTAPTGNVGGLGDGEAEKDFAVLLKDYNRAARLIGIMRERWNAVSDELDHIEGGMYADLEDAASAMASVCDDPLAALSDPLAGIGGDASPQSLLRQSAASAPAGCHCTDICMAPSIMGRQQPCRRPNGIPGQPAPAVSEGSGS